MGGGVFGVKVRTGGGRRRMVRERKGREGGREGGRKKGGQAGRELEGWTGDGAEGERGGE